MKRIEPAFFFLFLSTILKWTELLWSSTISFLFIIPFATVGADNRVFQQLRYKKCTPLKSNKFIKFTNTFTVGGCKTKCINDLKCLGYQYNGSLKVCHVLHYWPLTAKFNKGIMYCGFVKNSYFSPFITANNSSERVTIPDPPQPSTLKPSQSSCPHLQTGLKNWHDPATWPSGTIPISGQDVTLPSNSKVVITKKVIGSLGFITIPSSSQLIFAENSVPILISTKGFNVDGALIAGSETCLYRKQLKITLVGKRPVDAVTNVPLPVQKGISVTGMLQLHGQQFYRTWTRLAKTAYVGDDYIFLQHKVNWTPNKKIVLVTTAMKDAREWHQNEELTIDFTRIVKYASGQIGTMVYLKSNIQYQHNANSGYQAEVGLLSRNIVIQGNAADSEPTDPDPLNCIQNRWMWGGNRNVQCPDTELTGYGGHIMIHNGGKGYVEGVELYRMGQTNVLGRYPFHFHVLENNCSDCYFRSSSIHRSFYRCVSIHGTHQITVTENVAYDITGYCYYLEDGVEQENEISFNLAAHIHYLGDAAWGNGQTTSLSYQSSKLTLPADVTASGFYITNVHNYIVGNAASGGWAGFAFPSLIKPIGLHKSVNMRPSSVTGLTIDGNTAHSSGWWWYHASAFYFGGALYYASDGTTLVYNAGRDQSKGNRSPCLVDKCQSGDCNLYCQPYEQAWIRITNSKTFLVPGPGLNSWSGRMEIIGYEAHDVGLSLEALESGFFMSELLVVCRTGEQLVMPPNSTPTAMKGDGFFWYDTGQEHIITKAIYRNCGYRSDNYNQYDTSPSRGCGDSSDSGCNSESTVFGFLTHSDQFNPEVMQATKQITFDDCGRRFKLHDYRGNNLPSTVSGRLQNWLDYDGTASGLNVPTLIGSGQPEANMWWKVDETVIEDLHGPLVFIKKNDGPKRNLGHIHFDFDPVAQATVGSSYCGNGSLTCPPLGYIKHFGPKYANDLGLPVTANGDVAGLTGGFGWQLKLNSGAPKHLKLSQFEIHPESQVILGIAYPINTSITITSNAPWCSTSQWYTCSEEFEAVASHDLVVLSNGNKYHMDSNGFLTVKIIQGPQAYTGNPNWLYPSMDTVGKWGQWYAVDRFERDDVTLLKFWYGPWIDIIADCSGSSQNDAYCTGDVIDITVDVCSDGLEQISYDTCG